MVGLQLVVNGLVSGAVLALVALGFALVYNTTRIFHLAHGAAFVIAPYVAYSLNSSLGLPLVAASAMGVLASAAFGFAVAAAVYAPLFRTSASTTAFMVTSLGIYAVAVNLVALLWGNEPLELHPGVWNVVSLGPVRLSVAQLLQFGISVILIGAFLLVARTNIGRLLRAVRDDSELALVTGFDLVNFRVLAVVAASVLAGTGGVLRSLDAAADPHMGMSMILEAAVALFVGGAGTFVGPAVAGTLIGVGHGLTAWLVSSRWIEAMVFLILVTFVLGRPHGLFGSTSRAERVL